MPASDRPSTLPFSVEPIPGLVLHGDSAGDGVPIVLLHGLTATRRNVLQGSRHLLSRGCRLIGYDARGHGESSPAPDPSAYEIDDLATDLGAVLDQLGLERTALAGSSMGAATAVNFALTHPQRVSELVLITPAGTGPARTDPTELAHWDRLAEALEAGDIDAFVEESGAGGLPERWREAARLATRQRIERHRDLQAVAAALRVVPRSRAFPGLESLESLTMPTLVVGSRDDADPGHPLAMAEQYAQRMPSARLVVEDEGSSPLAWQGARLSKEIGQFLAESA